MICFVAWNGIAWNLVKRRNMTMNRARRTSYIDLGEGDWNIEIRPTASFFQLHLKELLAYRDLIFLFVRRDFKTMYKQTILGPAWILLHPLMSTSVFTIIFGRIANISTDGVPDFLFYMAGNILWTYFSACLLAASNTFLGNAGLFGKVYFPRMVTPISASLSKLITFGEQFLLFLLFAFRYLAIGKVRVTWWALATPFLLLELACLAMGTGMILASLTAKYRDLQVLVSFGMQLWMYATPIVYPLSQIPEKWSWLFWWNPVASVVECFRCGWLGSGSGSVCQLGVGAVITAVVLMIGMLLFNRTQRNFMDTI